MGSPSPFLVRALMMLNPGDRFRMAQDSSTPRLTSDDIAVLLKALRESGRPMTTAELVEALRAASR